MAFSKARRLGELVTTAGVLDQATVATASSGDNDTSPASTAFVTGAIADLADSAPSTLNTLNELAAALNDDASFSTTVTNSIATKVALSGSGQTIADSGNLTLDVAGDINLDAAGNQINFKNAGTTRVTFELDATPEVSFSGGNLAFNNLTQDADIAFKGFDSSTFVTALNLDMSNAGAATFNGNLTVNGADVTITSNIIHAGDTDTYFGFNDANTYRIVTGGSEALRVDSSQNVGIGTTSPTGKLEIAATGTNAAPHIKLVEDSDTREFNIFNDGSGNGRLVLADSDDDTPDTEIVLADNGVLQFKNATHESMTINSDGYVLLSRNANEYGLELRSTGTRSGLVLATPGAGNTIKGSLLLLTDNTLRLGTQSVYNIHMNQSGHNTMPNQPYIRCYGNYGGMASNHGTTADPWNYWAVGSSSGITHSSGVFTVPTTGRYLITYSFYNWMNNTGQGVTHAVYLYIGSTNVQETNNEFDMGNNSYSYYDNTLSNSIIYDLTAGDTFKFVTYADIYGGTSHTNMSAFLLG